MPVAELFKAEAVAVNDDGRNVEERQLQVAHVDAFRINIDGGDVQMLLIVDAEFTYFMGECDNHRAASHARF